MAVIVTWLKTYRHIREAAAAGVSVGISETLLQYGALYFAVLCVVSLIGGLIALVPRFQAGTPLGSFTSTLPNVVLSRFLINLRQVDSTDRSSPGTTRPSQFSALNFHAPSSIIGNLGEPLTDGEEDLHNEENDNIGSCEDCTITVAESGDDKGTSDTPAINSGGIEEVCLPFRPTTGIVTMCSDNYRLLVAVTVTYASAWRSMVLWDEYGS
ncbi:hypothetical protein NM688_g3887 [Phlebia brevispora]|uniref:Uncharacterized protein n=1 Tax=Phlebia brevispora TaxID=194682 RepID=A0ACC1T4M9_9APHY|nr:hypothetical protein NM688_g3887 [Phlebia brevispora]